MKLAENSSSFTDCSFFGVRHITRHSRQRACNKKKKNEKERKRTNKNEKERRIKWGIYIFICQDFFITIIMIMIQRPLQLLDCQKWSHSHQEQSCISNMNSVSSSTNNWKLFLRCSCALSVEPQSPLNMPSSIQPIFLCCSLAAPIWLPGSSECSIEIRTVPSHGVNSALSWESLL